MDRETIEQKITEFGFEGTEEYPFKYDEDGMLYAFPIESDQSCDVTINGITLYVSEIRFVKFEVDKWGLSIRLYCDNLYIGSIVNNWEDISDFEITRTM